MGLLTLHDTVCAGDPESARPHALPAPVRQAARAIMPCRTAAFGGHVPSCPDGHFTRLWSHSCRHRSCPQGADIQTERWLAMPQARRWAWDHSHGIGTRPHDLTPRWRAHGPVMRALLWQAVRDTLHDLLAAPQSLGAQPGVSAALHPWRQTLVLPPHVPGRVTGGGRTASGHWKAVRNGLLWPARVVMAVVRGQRLDAIRQAWAREALVLPEARRPPQVGHLLSRRGPPTTTRGNVRRMERYRHGAGVVTSLARSLRGGPITNARLVAWDGDRVTFPGRARHEEAAGGRTAHRRELRPLNNDNSNQHGDSCRMVSLPHATIFQETPMLVFPHHTDHIAQTQPPLVGETWATEVVPRLPATLAAQARTLTAFQRVRGLATPHDLLRGILADVLGPLSTRRLGAWAVLVGGADIAETAWRKRLRASNPWLLWLLNALVATSAHPDPLGARPQGRMLLVDASCLGQPGGTGDDWRLPLAYDFTADRLGQV